MGQTPQSPATTGTSNTVRELRARIDELERQLHEIKTSLEAAEHLSELPLPAIAEELPPATTLEDHEGTHRSSVLSPFLQIRGFGDVNYSQSTRKGETSAFSLGAVNLFMTSHLTDNVSVLGELVFEGSNDNRLESDFERFLVQYTPNDYFHLSAGRYHSAIGYYNMAYHHGTWFQTATARPQIFQFEDERGILPVHNVGFSLSGQIPSGRLGLAYVAEIGNGRASRSPADEPVQLARDENNHKSLNFGLRAKPAALPGFQTGFSWYSDRLTPAAATAVREHIAAAHVVYDASPWQLLAEGVLVRHSPEDSSKTWTSAAYYLQAARSLGSNQPYFRYDYQNSLTTGPIPGGSGRSELVSSGLKHTLNENSAFKLEYRWQRFARQDVSHGIAAQWAFTF